MSSVMSYRDDRGAFHTATPPRDASHRRVHMGSLELVNPVMPASGCFGPELGALIPVHELGAVVTKTVFAHPRGGNAPHRLTETKAGMVNSVGIPSEGPHGYIQRRHSAYRAFGIPVIISVGGHRTGEYATVVSALAEAGDAYELNVSCPNLDHEGTEIGADPFAIEETVRSTRRVTNRPLIVKLPAMTASIADCARAAEAAGADAVCVKFRANARARCPHSKACAGKRHWRTQRTSHPSDCVPIGVAERPRGVHSGNSVRRDRVSAGR